MSFDENPDAFFEEKNHFEEKVIPISGMYEDYFLDYASYVILERAVPHINDGLKPVQRRILYSLREKDDGRYHKVANIIGHTMQYHPHGDAAIGSAMVNIGQKNLMIDCQGNWGDVRTGDSAAAPRYIEARLTKFALEVAFNAQTTAWQVSYDGRNNEPVTLPMKFPLLLAHGVEGIAVGLATKILPHNFIELIKASIKVLEDKPFKLYPDFDQGGYIDVSDYNKGQRGGKVKVRAKIEIEDKSTLLVTELPYGVTSGSLIESILKAADKGTIKIKKVMDNTAKDVEIRIELASGISPQVTMDALYAFTSCESSISINACVIVDNKPLFLTVPEILRISTFRTKDLLKQELEIKLGELEEKWHMASLEKIFIEKRIYRDIEECESWEQVLQVVDLGLRKYVAVPSDSKESSAGKLMLHRDITVDDITKLTEIRIRRISKYNVFKADERIQQIEEEISQIKYNLANLTQFAIDYFENLLIKYGKGRERKTTIIEMEEIKATQVVANNTKLYVDRKEGFIGTGLKKDEFVADCSDIADIISFRRDGTFQVNRIGDKVFVGKDIIHVAVWEKDDERTTYNLIYVDAKSGNSMAKRFNVKSITRDKEYDLTSGAPKSKILYFTVNPNGESEIVNVQLSPGCKAKKKTLDFDFGEIAIKGRGSKGNIVTKYPVKKMSQVSVGKSSLGAQDIWIDEVSGRINKDERGKFIGSFDTGAQLLAVFKDGSYEVRDLEIDYKFDMNKVTEVFKFGGQEVVSAIYYDGEKGWTMVKRFRIETSSLNQLFKFISESKGSKLYYVSVSEGREVQYSYKSGGNGIKESIDIDSFIDVKGWKAGGNKLGEFKLLSVKEVKVLEQADPETITEEEANSTSEDAKKIKDTDANKSKYSTGDTIEFDF